jgi:hypothetical protein
MNGASPRLVLRDLPLPARLVLAVFLISVGIGYFSALVQLHFQHARPGSPLPDDKDVTRVYSGGAAAEPEPGDKNKSREGRPKSKVEKLLEADEDLPFTRTGQMRSAFTNHKWRQAIDKKVKDLAKGRVAAINRDTAEAELRKEREGERQVVLAWVRAGAHKEFYDKDSFLLPEDLKKQPITPAYLIPGDGAKVGPKAAKITSILKARCVRCHQPAEDGSDDPKAAKYLMQTYDLLKPYVTVTEAPAKGGEKAEAAPDDEPPAMSLTNLAQSTHVHLLGFSMLYGLTGLILAFSGLPCGLRVVLCPLPLVAQVVDISFWWLARLDKPYGPEFARAIIVSGGVVAAGLGLQIVLSLFSLFGKTGRLVLVLLLGGALAGAYVVKDRVIDPYLAKEKSKVTVSK